MAQPIDPPAVSPADTNRDLAKVRTSALRWTQRWWAPGSELRLLLEDAVIDYDPQKFLAALKQCEGELTTVDLMAARRLGTRWARLADAISPVD